VAPAAGLVSSEVWISLTDIAFIALQLRLADLGPDGAKVPSVRNVEGDVVSGHHQKW
jgi:hypothetical protein